jgi:hypothetical protein
MLITVFTIAGPALFCSIGLFSNIENNATPAFGAFLVKCIVKRIIHKASILIIGGFDIGLRTIKK